MGERQLHLAPIWDDIRTLRAGIFKTVIDIISGGTPCQNISVTGDGTGLDGEQSKLFFELMRLVSELRPRFVFMENSPAITLRGLDRVLLEFTALGYECRWTIVSAAEVGALHLRERWFLLAYLKSSGLQESGRRVGEAEKITRPTGIFKWPTEPCVDRVVYGLPNRVDRIRGLGNAVVPQTAREAFQRLLGI